MINRILKIKITDASQNKIYWSFIGVVTLFYLIVSMHTPISVMVWQAYDDMLFINHAQSLAEGRWLGKFSELTLVKGPGYPVFLAINYWLGLPVTIAHALFYCFSLVAISLLILRVTRSYFLASLLFVVPLWDPRVLELSRVVRDAIYSGQSILVISFFAYVLLSVNTKTDHDKMTAVSGVLLGWFWLTREEGIWLIPSLIFLFSLAFIRNRYQSNKTKIIRPLLISMLFFSSTLFVFSLGNKIAYGEFVGVDLKEKNFQSAYKSMESIRLGESIPFVSVPRSTRLQIYKISPGFAELKEHIDPEGRPSVWEAGGCLFRPTSCGDISNGFFYFAMREAAAIKGYYSSPEKASKFFKQINEDIQSACRDKQFICESSNMPYMPPISWSQIRSIPSTLSSMIASIYSPGVLYESTPWKIWGPESTFNRALSILNYPTHYPMIGKSSDVELAGWYHHKGKGNDWFQLKVSDNSNDSLPYTLLRLDSQDLVETFGDSYANQQRFKINTRCSDGCQLTISSAAHSDIVYPVNYSQKFISSGNTTLAFDYINMQNDLNQTENIRVKFSLSVRTFLYYIYELLLPLLLVLGISALFTSWYLAFKKSDYSIILVVATTCWIAIFSRVVILTLVDISSFPAVIVPYMQPIYTLSIISSILSIGAMIRMYRKSESHT